MQSGNTIAIVDKTLGQLMPVVFPDKTLGDVVWMQQNPDFYELIFNLEGNYRRKPTSLSAIAS